MNRFRQHKVRAETERLGHAGLTFDHGDRERSLVGTGVTSALEKQRRVLLVVAVHDDGVEVLDHQFLDGGKGLVAGLDTELEFTQHLADNASRFFIRAEQ